MREITLIIGSEGFIGRKFIECYLSESANRNNLFMVDIRNIIKNNYFSCDCSKFENINNIIQKLNPDIIYNFAGSFSNNFETDYKNNVIVTKNILDSIIRNKLDSKIIINGSAAEYGFIKNDDFPINEDYPLNPISFYGLSKVFQTYLARAYYLRDNIKIFITRPFNIIGYGISEKLFIGRLINQIKKYLEQKEKISLGNLNNERDYLDIDDLISAYKLIIMKGKPGEIYNIGSGNSIKIRMILNLFLKVFNIEKSEVIENKSSISKFDIKTIKADISKLKEFDWIPKVSIEKSIKKIKNSISMEL